MEHAVEQPLCFIDLSEVVRLERNAEWSTEWRAFFYSALTILNE
jgi:hypothetical protein